jgi:hypothetical protein
MPKSSDDGKQLQLPVLTTIGGLDSVSRSSEVAGKDDQSTKPKRDDRSPMQQRETDREIFAAIARAYFQNRKG